MKLPSFVESILARAGYINSEKAATPGVMGSSTTDPFTIWAQQKKISAKKALEVYTGWVYAAVRAIATDVGSIEFTLFKIGKEADEEIFDHEILDLLGAMNNYEIGLATKFATVAHLQITGNAYWYLEGVNDDAGKPTAIHVLNPADVKVIYDRDEFPPRVQGYEYRTGQKIWTFQPYQIIHFKDPDPSDPIQGIGVVQSIAQWVDADNYAMEFNRRFFINGARIGGFLESESAYTPEQLTYLKESFEATFKGVENAYKVLALPKGTKYEEGGKTQKDLDFANLMTMMRDRIIAGFKVPRTALGITDDVNRANAEATDYVFAARTIRPAMKFITAYLNEFLVPRFDDGLYLSFKDPVPEDRKQRMTEMRVATGGAAVITPNEARADYFGKDPIEGGDELPEKVDPIEMNANEGGELGGEKTVKAVRKNKRPVKSRFAQNAARRRSIAQTMAQKAADIMTKTLEGIAAIKKKGVAELATLTDEQYETIYKGFALRTESYEKKYKKAIQELNEEQHKEVRGNLAELAKGNSYPDLHAKLAKAELFDYAKSLAAFVRVATPIMTELAKEEGKEAAALLAIDNMDILTEEVQRGIEHAVRLTAESYNKTTQNLLKGKLEEGLKEGLSQAELAERIATIYEYSDEARAQAVARTETFRIANYATEEAWKQSGIVKTKVWYTAADERVCPYCGPMHGKVVSIDQNYFEKGATIPGSDGTQIVADYDDISGGALHVNCRCYIRPGEIRLE